MSLNMGDELYFLLPLWLLLSPFSSTSSFGWGLRWVLLVVVLVVVDAAADAIVAVAEREGC